MTSKSKTNQELVEIVKKAILKRDQFINVNTFGSYEDLLDEKLGKKSEQEILKLKEELKEYVED